MAKERQRYWHDFENPPVIEVVCGIQFEPVENLLVPHFGALWEKFKPDYSRCREVVPLEPVVERFGESPQPAMRLLDVPPLPRIWFLSEDEARIIQVQRDRFLHNWKKVRAEDQYPRYRTVVETFRSHLRDFQSFLKEANLGEISPFQYEMTYVNIIPGGEGWQEIGDVGQVFPDFNWRTNNERFLAAPEKLLWIATFLLPDNKGRLHTRIGTAERQEDGHPAIKFELTIRGIPDDKSEDEMQAWFDMANEWIVRGFVDLTSSQIQENVWRRTK